MEPQRNHTEPHALTRRRHKSRSPGRDRKRSHTEPQRSHSGATSGATENIEKTQRSHKKCNFLGRLRFALGCAREVEAGRLAQGISWRAPGVYYVRMWMQGGLPRGSFRELLGFIILRPRLPSLLAAAVPKTSLQDLFLGRRPPDSLQTPGGL